MRTSFLLTWALLLVAGGFAQSPARTGKDYGEDGLLSFAELAATLDQFREPRPVWGDFVRSTLGGLCVCAEKWLRWPSTGN